MFSLPTSVSKGWSYITCNDRAPASPYRPNPIGHQGEEDSSSKSPEPSEPSKSPSDASPIPPQTEIQTTADIRYSHPWLDQDIVSTHLQTESQNPADSAQAIYETSSTLISIQKDFKNIRACFKWIEVNKGSPEHAAFVDEFTSLMTVYERLVSQTKEDALKLKVHGPNKFTLLVENVVLDESLADSEVASELNHFLEELPSGPWKEPQTLDELERGLEKFRDEFQRRVPVTRPSQLRLAAEINSTLRNDPLDFAALHGAVEILIANVKVIGLRLVKLTALLNLMGDETRKYIAVINPSITGVGVAPPRAPPGYYQPEMKLNARRNLEVIATLLKPVGAALGDLAARTR